MTINWDEYLKPAKETPDKVALIYGDQTISYQKLEENVTAVSKLLSAYQIGPGSRVGIYMGNHPQTIYVLLAVARLGASCMLLNTAFKKYEISDYLIETSPRLLIADPTTNKMITTLGLPEEKHDLTAEDEFGELHIWEINDNAPNKPKGADRAESEFNLIFTSGVSGKSRIVSRSYGNVGNEVFHLIEALSLSPEDRALCAAPVFHSFGLHVGSLPILYAGGTLILMNGFNPNQFMNDVETYRPTLFVGVPFMYDLICKTPAPETVDFSSLRICLTAGAKIKPETVRNLKTQFGIGVNPLYGSSEAGAMTICFDEDLLADPGAVGAPLGDKTIKIVDDDDSELPAGAEGNIILKSAATSAGYVNQPTLNKTIFKDGWYYSGDLGRLDENGNLYLTGRKSAFINIGGMKVDPFEVEQVLRSHDSVADAAVIGVESKQYGEAVKAFVVVQNEISAMELIQFCREKLADYKMPREVVFLEKLPRSATGKILKKYLEKPISEL